MTQLPQYRAAVIGCGRIGAEESLYAKAFRPATHAAIFYGHARIQTLVLVDNNVGQLRKAGRAFPRARIFQDIDVMMQEVRPHIVSVAVSTQAHEAVVKAIVKYHPLAIICEKPLASTIASAARIVKVCKANNVALFVNHNRRFDEKLVAVKQEVKRIGPIVQGSVQYTRGIFNNGTHAVDLLRFYLGEVDAVLALRNRQTEDWRDLRGDLNVDGILLFKSGARIALQSFGANNYRIFDISLYGKKGRILLTQSGFRIEYQSVKKNSGIGGFSELQYGNSRMKGGIRSMMKGLTTHVIDCLDGKVKPVSTGEEGLATLRILEALKKSAHLRGKLIKVASLV